MTRAPQNNPATFEATVTLPDGTRAQLRATWDRERGVGGYILTYGSGAGVANDLPPDEWRAAMRRLLGRRESGREIQDLEEG